MARISKGHGLTAAVSLLMIIGTAANADEPTASGGYFGLSPEHSLQISERWNARFSTDQFYRDPTSTSGAYTGQGLDLGGPSAVLDWHPIGGGFRFSGGLLNTTPTELQFQYGSDPSDALYGSGNAVSSNPFDSMPSVPYLGLGWNSFDKAEGGWGFNVDVGMLFPEYSDVAPWAGETADRPRLGAGLDSGLSGGADADYGLGELDRVPVFSFGARYRW